MDFILFVCFVCSIATTALLVVLLTKQIVEYRHTSGYLQMLREEIKRTRLFRMRQLEIWQKSRQRHSKR